MRGGEALKNSLFGGCIFFSIFVTQGACAQANGGIDPRNEYRKRIAAQNDVAALSGGLFGEKTSLYSGNTSFTVVDVDLAGNNSLPVQLGRHIAIETQPQSALSNYDTRIKSIGNWNVDVPYVTATYPVQADWPAQRCSFSSFPGGTLGHFNRLEHWHGISVHVPGRGRSNMLSSHGDPQVPRPSDGAQYGFSTAERDSFTCIPMQSGLAGEGFRMTTVDGIRYYFDIAVSRRAATLKKSQTTISGSTIAVLLTRNQHYLLASKIEDRFGNNVQYEYNASGHPIRIWSNDGREIVLSYTSDRLSSVAAHGRTWQYSYGSEGNLTEVTLPDGGQWQYAYSGTLLPRVGPGEVQGAWDWCAHEDGPSGTYALTAKHPSGAQGGFQFLRRRHYRSGVHANECMQEGEPQNPIYTLLVPNYFDVMSLSSKVISGAGLSSGTWSYNYGDVLEGLWGSHTQPANYPCTTCTPYKTVTVTNPDGTKERQRFGIVYKLNDGRLLLTESLAADGAVVRSESVQYVSDTLISSLPFHGKYGSDSTGVWDTSAAAVRPVEARAITQQGRIFKWQVASNCGAGANLLCFDSLARPTRVTKSSMGAP